MPAGVLRSLSGFLDFWLSRGLDPNLPHSYLPESVCHQAKQSKAPQRNAGRQGGMPLSSEPEISILHSAGPTPAEWLADKARPSGSAPDQTKTIHSKPERPTLSNCHPASTRLDSSCLVSSSPSQPWFSSQDGNLDACLPASNMHPLPRTKELYSRHDVRVLRVKMQMSQDHYDVMHSRFSLLFEAHIQRDNISYSPQPWRTRASSRPWHALRFGQPSPTLATKLSQRSCALYEPY